MGNKRQMLSDLIIADQRIVLVIDEPGHERNAHKFIRQFLREQQQDESTIKILSLYKEMRDAAAFDKLLCECGFTKMNTETTSVMAITTPNENLSTSTKTTWNIILPTMVDILCYQQPSALFHCLHQLRKCSQIKRIFLWVSLPYMLQKYATTKFIVAACEYMADLVLHLHNENELSCLVRKSGGGITNKLYNYKLNSNGFFVESNQSEFEVKQNALESKSTTDQKKQIHETGATFKIELEEEELIARNALKLPYEKTAESNEGSITYTPDAADDFDEEDPDEDLCI